jgi:hypothetical protein
MQSCTYIPSMAVRPEMHFFRSRINRILGDALLTLPSASQARSCASRLSLSAFCRAASSRRRAAPSRSSALSLSVARPAARFFSASSRARSSAACAVNASRPDFAAASAGSAVASRPWYAEYSDFSAFRVAGCSNPSLPVRTAHTWLL